MGQFLKYKADRLPILCVLLVFVFDLSVFVYSPWWGAVAWLLAGILPKSFIAAFNHHHQHLATFGQPILNRLLEIVYGFQTGVTSQAWFLHHVIGHHRHYLDQEHDESRWARADGSKMEPVEYSLSVAVTGYPRAFRAGTEFRHHQRLFVIMLLVQLTLLAGLFWWNWFNALFVFLLPMAISLYITAWHTYYHHAGLAVDDDMHASYNIIHPCYNRFTGNLGYHTAHHLRGGLHWSKLPDFHAEIAEQIPPHLYRRPCIPFRWIGKREVIAGSGTR